MNKRNLLIGSIAITAATLSSCHTALQNGGQPSEPAYVTIVESDPTQIGLRNSAPATALPKATAFKMNGNYANHVAVTLDANGNLIYFPAPSDITANSRPVDLGNGWWLNRQGFPENPAFLEYTFEEYAALPTTPSIKEIKKKIIPGSGITYRMLLPFTINEAENNLPSIRNYIELHKSKF